MWILINSLTQGLEEGGIMNYCVMVTEFQLRKMKNCVYMNGHNGCTQNNIDNNTDGTTVTVVNFILCILCHQLQCVMLQCEFFNSRIFHIDLSVLAPLN
jgi:hypothetical protein